MPDPLDNFGEAYRELLDASDDAIEELASQSFREPPSDKRRQIVVEDKARIKAARVIQQQREAERVREANGLPLPRRDPRAGSLKK
jgi:hypothetical protein